MKKPSSAKTFLYFSMAVGLSLGALPGCGDDDDDDGPVAGSSGQAGTSGSGGTGGSGGSSGAGGSGGAGGSSGMGGAAGAGGSAGTGGVSGAGGGPAGAGGAGGGAGEVFDASFGEGGFVELEGVPISTGVFRLSLGPEGRIDLYLPGSGSVSMGAVLRLRDDGAPDEGFGDGGFALDLGPSQFDPWSMRTQPDGKVVLGGIGLDVTTFGAAPSFTRLNPDGTRDATFGENGFSAIGSSGDGRAYDFDVSGDGRLFAVGPGLASSGIAAFATRALPDGTLDTSFHEPDGYHLYAPDPAPSFLSEYMYVARAAAEGFFYSCGIILNDPGDSPGPFGEMRDWDFLLLRYTPEGQLDEGFGEGGAVWVDHVGATGPFELVDNRCGAVAEAPGGKVVFGGDATSRAFDSLSNFVVMRLLADGSPDPSFADAGVLELDVGSVDRLDSLVVLPDGSIVGAGISGGTTLSPVLFLVRPDGALEPGFGEGGIYHFDRPNRGALPVRIDRQPDGKIVVAGNAPGPFVARLNPL